ncbi:hypothetical protein SLA2020_125470 [Shorea laevis]
MAFNKNLFTLTLILFSFLSFRFLTVFSPIKSAGHSLSQSTARLRQPPLSAAEKNESWFDVIGGEIKGRKIKIGLVNIDDHESARYSHHLHGLAEFVNIRFDPVSKDMKWEEFFPEWVDEKARWGLPKCPKIPMPRLEDYRDLDVVVARVPCGRGSRDLFRLQVNLVVANLVVESGWITREVARPVYAVFAGGSCGPMPEIFRCNDVVKQVGDYSVYKPELNRLKQKVLMPVGSCQLAPPYAETGEEGWIIYSNTNRTRPRKAYVTILHSSEAYVCGAIALAQSIRLTSSSKDLILLHDVSISDHSLLGLKAAGWQTRRIRRIRSPFSKKDAYNEWNYSKLRVWQLEDYDKVIFIDADLLILQNIEDFFVYPELSAAKNDRCLFNSGIMLVEPSSCMFEDLMRKSFTVASYNGGDQGFLNEVFTWWHRWPTKVNFLKNFGKKKERGIPEDVYAIHYLGWKPWTCYRDYDCNWDNADRRIFASDEAHKMWWRVYDAIPEKLRRYCAMTVAVDKRIKEWRARARNGSFSDGHWKIEVKDPRQYNLVP